MDILIYIIIAVAVIVVLWVVFSYNSFIRLINRTKEAWADIDVQLKRRYDLIPNLVETVKGYATHEKEAFESVTEARARALGAGQRGDPKEIAKTEGELSSALKSIFAVAEAYPDLKASQNFQELQRELSDTENKIQAARRFYNGQVRDFNTKIQVFPTNTIASMLKFKAYEFFAADEQEKKNVEVKF